MPTLKSRFHGTTSAFCSVTVEEIVRGETREEKMFVVETLDQESRREAERKGREERKQRQQAIVLSLLVVRLPAVTSPLFTPTPESNSLAAFLFRHFDIHCATDSNPFVAGPVKGTPILKRIHQLFFSELIERKYNSSSSFSLFPAFNFRQFTTR